MAFRTKKISQMDPKGSNLASTDLLEISQLVSGSYVTKSITGAEIIDSIPVPPSGITIGTTAITSGTVGRVLFEGTGNVVQESANLFFDSVNNRFGVGGTPTTTFDLIGTSVSCLLIRSGSTNMIQTASSGIAGSDFRFRLFTANQAQTLDLYGSGDYDHQAKHAFRIGNTERMRIVNTGNVLINTTTDAGFKLDVNGNSRVKGAGATDGTNAFVVQNSAGSSALTVANGLTTIVHGDLQLVNTVLYWASGSQIRNISNGVLRITNSSNSDFTRLQFGGGTTAFPSLQRSGSALAIMDATGTALSNLLIGTTTDAGFKLDVVGNTRVTNITTPLIYTTGSDTLTLATQGGTSAVTVFPTTRNVLIQNGGTPVDAGFRLDVNGTARFVGQVRIGGEIVAENASTLTLSSFNTADAIKLLSQQTFVGSVGDRFFTTVQANFSPTSGTSTFALLRLSTIINQTGGANGITRGLYIAPTLTSASDFRAIETTNGKVIFGNLPTSPAGLPTGAIWNNLGILTIV